MMKQFFKALLILLLSTTAMYGQQLKQIQKGTANDQITVTNGLQFTQVYRDAAPYILDSLGIRDSISLKLKNSPTINLRIENDSLRADIKKRLNATTVGGSDTWIHLTIDSTGQITDYYQGLNNDFDKDPNNELQYLTIDSVGRVFEFGLFPDLYGTIKFEDRVGITDTTLINQLISDSLATINQDEIVSIVGAGITYVSGTYPNFTATSTEVDGSVTNEIQTLSQTFTGTTQANANLSLSGGTYIDTTGFMRLETMDVTPGQRLYRYKSNLGSVMGMGEDPTLSGFSNIEILRDGNILSWGLSKQGATTGKIWKYNGTRWALADDNTGTGTVTGVTASTPLSSSGGVAPNISISTANGSTTGALSSTDWNLFNNKVGGSGTTNQFAYFSGTNTLTSSPVFYFNTHGVTLQKGTWNAFINGGNNTLSGTANVAIGSNQTLSSITSGRNNVALGNAAGFSNTIGSDNFYMGYLSGYSNTSSSDNTYIGASAGYLTTGSSNVCLGSGAGRNSTNTNNTISIGAYSGYLGGSDNINIGYYSGFNSTGGQNVKLGTFSGQNGGGGTSNFYGGYYAGQGNTGNNNVAIGWAAGATGDGNSNIFLGYEAGRYESGSNTLYLSNSSGTTSGIFGHYENGRFGVNQAPSLMTRTFDINGELRVRDLTTTIPTRIMSADADGVVSSLGLSGLSISGGNLTVASPQTFIDWSGTEVVSWFTTGSFNSGKRVGLGVFNPTRQLDANGDVRLRGAIYNSSNSAGTSGQVLTSQGTGAWTWATPSTGGSALAFEPKSGSSVALSLIGTASTVNINDGVGTTVVRPSSNNIQVNINDRQVVSLRSTSGFTRSTVGTYTLDFNTVELNNAGSVYTTDLSNDWITINTAGLYEFDFDGYLSYSASGGINIYFEKWTSSASSWGYFYGQDEGYITSSSTTQVVFKSVSTMAVGDRVRVRSNVSSGGTAAGLKFHLQVKKI